MARTALIANARSHLVARKGSRLESVARNRPATPLIWFESMPAFSAQIGDLLDSGYDTFLIEGGDGTVVAALTSCFRHDPGAFGDLSFAILPGGSTNLVHEKLGLKDASPQHLMARIDAIEAGDGPAGEADTIHALLIEQADPASAHVGFLLSIGSLALGMDHVQHHMLGQGARGPSAIALSLLRLAARPRHYKAADGAPLLRPTRLDLHAQDAASLSGQHAFALASTLPSLSLGISPFWGRGSGPLHVTYAPWPPEKLRRAVFHAATGTGLATLERNGYRSFNTDAVTMELDGPVMLDGELLTLDRAASIRVRTTDEVRFLR